MMVASGGSVELLLAVKRPLPSLLLKENIMNDFFMSPSGREFINITIPRIADALEKIAEKYAQTKAAEIVELGLCEFQNIIPRMDRLYHFSELPNCEKCKAIAETYRKEDY